MPNPVNNRKHQQWDTCDRCGRLFPIGRLVKQKGLLVCDAGCVDDLTVERRDFIIGQMLSAGETHEGVDLRVIDRGFFDQGSDEGVS